MDHLLEHLYRQHREAERMLARLSDAEALLRREGLGAPGLFREFESVRAALRAEIASHFREEEWALFPLLGRHLGLESGPIAAMVEEHAAYRRLQLELDTGLAALESGMDRGWEVAVSTASRGILALLPGHIEKEDEVLFPMADDLLDDAEWAEANRLART